jgi:excisionase family DNA binding protein
VVVRVVTSSPEQESGVCRLVLRRPEEEKSWRNLVAFGRRNALSSGAGFHRIMEEHRVHQPPESLMDIHAVAHRLGVQTRHVRRLVYERRIPYLKWGHLLRFDPDEIERWLDATRRPPREEDPPRAS